VGVQGDPQRGGQLGGGVATAAPRHVNKITVDIKRLHAMIDGVRHVNVVRRIEDNAPRETELAIGQARAAPLTLKHAGVAEFLNAMVLGVHHINLALRIESDALRRGELAGAATVAPPAKTEFAAGGEDLDAVVAGIGDVKVAGRRVKRDGLRDRKLPVGAAALAASLEEKPFRSEFLHAVIIGIHNVNIVVGIYGNALRPAKLAG